jgi:hypothetical protein
MVEGEKRRLWIPSGLAYGDHGNPAGPLVFDVELLSILAPPPPPPGTWVPTEEHFLENGAPVEPRSATQWYWAIQHAAADAWGYCSARRVAKWYTIHGQNAFVYYWTHVPDGHTSAHHSCELPFLFGVQSETKEQSRHDGGMFHINASSPRELMLSTNMSA